MKTLKSIKDIKNFFLKTKHPIYFVGPTQYNVIGLEAWIPNIKYFTLIDSFENKHPNVMTTNFIPEKTFENTEEINNFILTHKNIVDQIEIEKIMVENKQKQLAMCLFFDEKTEEIAKKLNLNLAFPSFKLRNHIDNKIVTTQIGNEAGVSSVPNVLSKVTSFSQLKKLASQNKLGSRLVIQTAYGDSGKTTYFVHDKESFDKIADKILCEEKVKIMKEIQCVGTAIEGCVTKNGTIVGPLLSELVGFDSLTPHKGGWCGNEKGQFIFDKKITQKARKYTEKIGAVLAEKGYKGYFEIDFLIDQNTHELYLGELNPRITGASPITNSLNINTEQLPLILFHILEYLNVPYELDVKNYNNLAMKQENENDFSQIILKQTENNLNYIDKSPETGIYEITPFGEIVFIKESLNYREITNKNQLFFYRILKHGDYAVKGTDLGILMLPRRAMDENFKITDQANLWINQMKNQFVSYPYQGVRVETNVHVSPLARVEKYKVF